MKVETFFEKFDLFAEAPGAVARMREIVLRLALNGRIVGLDSQKWEIVELGSLGEWGSGGTPLRNEPSYYNGPIPWLVIGDLNDGLVTKAENSITQAGLANSSAKLIPKGVLLIAMYGSIGKLGITGIECATNQAIAYCKPYSDRIDLRYLFYAIKGIQPSLLARGQGLAQKNISQTILKAWEIGLPSLSEQKRILAKVDELMVICDLLESQQKVRGLNLALLCRSSLDRFSQAPTPANLNFIFHKSYEIAPAELRKAILSLAVQGRLVPQDLNEEPAELLINKLIEGRRKLNDTKKFKEKADLPELNESEIQSEVPNNWKWVRLGNVCERISDGFHHSATKLANGVKYISATHISDGGIDWDSKLFVSEKDYSDLYSKVKQGFGDILIVNRGAGCGDAAIVNSTERFCFQNAAILGFDTNLILSEFMLLLLKASRTSFLEKYMRGGAQPMISNSLLTMHVVPIAPLGEQRRIVAKVNELMAIVDHLEALHVQSSSAGKHLLDALVAELAA